jgi:hypothetical protein
MGAQVMGSTLGFTIHAYSNQHGFQVAVGTEIRQGHTLSRTARFAFQIHVRGSAGLEPRETALTMCYPLNARAVPH